MSRESVSNKSIPFKFKSKSNSFKSHRALIATLLILLSSISGIPVFANAAEPPEVVILVPGAPSDLKVSVYYNDQSKFVEGHKTKNAIESQIKFFRRDLPENTDYTFEVQYGSERFEVTLDKPIDTYHATYTLDLETRTLMRGETLMRNVTLVGLRVSTTLLLEGLIFWLLGFREKRTWVIFLIMNLLTQGILNLMLATNPVSASYVLFGLIFGEIFVFIAECVIALTWMKEHGSSQRFSAVFIANFVSLVLGGFLISILPI